MIFEVCWRRRSLSWCGRASCWRPPA